MRMAERCCRTYFGGCGNPRVASRRSSVTVALIALATAVSFALARREAAAQAAGGYRCRAHCRAGEARGTLERLTSRCCRSRSRRSSQSVVPAQRAASVDPMAPCARSEPMRTVSSKKMAGVSAGHSFFRGECLTTTPGGVLHRRTSRPRPIFWLGPWTTGRGRSAFF